MSERNDVMPAIEPDRHELHAPSQYRFDFTRRAFLGTTGAGVIVLLAARRTPSGDDVEPDVRQQDPIAAWLHVAEDGGVTVYTGKVEVGQDIRTSLTQTVADELHVPPASVRMVMGDTDLTPFDAGTFGSRTTPQMGPQLRRAAAAARNVLTRLAAEQWDVDATRLTLREGRVTGGGRSAGIGELTQGARLVQTIGDIETSPPEQWTVAGARLEKVSGRDVVTGRHRFTTDLREPGMLIGKVLRPPAVGATLASFDGTLAQSMPGVVVVRDGDFAGVAAPDEATANRALAALRAEWTTTPQPSHHEIFDYLKQNAGGNPRPNERGSIDAGLAEADERLEATYTTAYIAHVPLEPRAAFARWDDGKVTVQTGTQRPFGVQRELAQAFRIPEERVRVQVPDTGSGYGGKHTGEAAIEAARLSRAADAPVRLTWTREEEFHWAYFRPAALIEIRSGVRRDGTITAWEFHNYNAGSSGIRTGYAVPNDRTVYHASDTPLRQGSYRALAATANNFARESHIDDLAASVGMDPLTFRLHNLRDDRLRAVLEAAAERFGWSQWQPSEGRGIGIACGAEKGGYVATCAEVEADVSTGRVRIVRIVEAFECGAIVNPDGLENQVVGAVIQGLGGALFEAIEFENGRILNGRLSQYRVPRLSDVPPIDAVLVDRRELLSAGAGETPIITVAPAIGNAIFRATGVRLRALPLIPNGLPVSSG